MSTGNANSGHQSLEEGTALPRMVSPPPGPKSRELAGRLSKVEPPTSSVIARGQTPVFWERTRGANIEDVDGNLYIDLTAGFCVATAGHSNPRIVRAIAEQSQRMLHTQGGLNPNQNRVELAEKLAERAPGDLSVSHIANTGAEAVETALKTARLYTGRHKVIAFQGGSTAKRPGRCRSHRRTTIEARSRTYCRIRRMSRTRIPTAARRIRKRMNAFSATAATWSMY